MNVLIYANRNKEKHKEWLNDIENLLKRENIGFSVITRDDLDKSLKADALFVFGGDGTILAMVDFVNRNNIPIIGINAGKLGFLSEFEKEETEDAVLLLKNNALKKDERISINVKNGKESFVALNDVVLQRIYTGGENGLVSDISFFIDGDFVDEITGDGIILSTPTGSTAYSLSAGGSILAPGINAISMTPLAAHSLHYRPVVFSADSTCEFCVNSGYKTGVFADGRLVFDLSEGEKITVEKSSTKTVFLRRDKYSFYKRLSEKLYGKSDR